ncbi:hypothetical protein [Zhongshania sp.]|uniref:hypothetical protein n=1 Tax=Zhongshania sp. TaxID=1971902 RepID=UPI00356216DE
MSTVFPHRRIHMTVQHPSIGDGKFSRAVNEALAEKAQEDPAGSLLTFKASNGVLIQVTPETSFSEGSPVEQAKLERLVADVQAERATAEQYMDLLHKIPFRHIGAYMDELCADLQEAIDPEHAAAYNEARRDHFIQSFHPPEPEY